MSAGKRPTLLAYRIVCTDQDALRWRENNIGNPRVTLNALVRLFRLLFLGSVPLPPPGSKKAEEESQTSLQPNQQD